MRSNFAPPARVNDALGNEQPYWSRVLRSLRTTRGLTQDGWSARLGVGRTTVQRWERGETVPDAAAEAALVAVCRELSLFRPFEGSPLQGQPLTPDLLGELLAAARLDERPQASSQAGHGTSGVVSLSGGAPPALPTGTITFLFTDVEGSTRLWEAHPAAMRGVMAGHDALLTSVFERHDGVVVRPRGEGDSLFAVFVRASDAVAAAVAGQRALAAEDWGTIGPLRVRMGLHTGEADLREGDYYGSAVNRCARIRAAGHGGQILLSQATANLTRNTMPAGAMLRDLGEHRLRDLTSPERIYQVEAPELHPQFPPLKTLDSLPNNLPQQLTSFVGREAELDELAALLGRARLVTLVGTGGVGKTRLALHVAGALLEHYPQGCWFIDLAPLSAPDLVPQAVAAPLGVQETPGYPLMQALVRALKSQCLLLVLDNCEHLIAACAELAAALLAGCPEVSILATSREALGIGGETRWRVPSLPTAAADTFEQDASVDAVAQLAGPRLFVERAQAIQPAFALTPQTAPAVARICRRLDGIPLAIELAAARVRVLTPEQIAGRLDESFRLLTGGSRTAPPRQQTLRGAIDWSYDLLDEWEQTLLRRLAVFAGGSTIEAAEEVCADAALPADDVLDVLTRLVDKSLVLIEAGDGSSRVRLLETVRQYAAEKLGDAGEEEAFRTRHRDCFAALAARFEPCLSGAANPEPLYRLLEADLDNLRAAVEWSRRPGDDNAIALARMVTHLYILLGIRGRRGELLSWLEDAVERCAQAPLPLRALLLAMTAQEIATHGDVDRALPLARLAVELSQETGDAWTIGHALNAQSRVLQLHRDPRAIATGEEAAALLAEAGAQNMRTDALVFSAMAAEAMRDLARAVPLFEEALANARRQKGRYTIGICLLFFVRQARRAGDYAEAAARLKETLELWGHESPFYFAHVLEEATKIAARVGQPELAVLLASAGERQRGAAGAPLLQADRPGYDRALDAVRAGLGEEAFTKAWAAGQSWTPRHAADEVAAFLDDVTHNVPADGPHSP